MFRKRDFSITGPSVADSIAELAGKGPPSKGVGVRLRPRRCLCRPDLING